MSRKRAAETTTKLVLDGEALCGEAIVVLRSLVEDCRLPLASALVQVAPLMAELWSARGGPAALEADPTAYPLDRAVLRALGWDLPAERSVEAALGFDPTAGGCGGCGGD